MAGEGAFNFGKSSPAPCSQLLAKVPANKLALLKRIEIKRPHFSFAIFCPKIACQAPEGINSLPNNNIRAAF
jgi:hypothetical protein